MKQKILKLIKILNKFTIDDILSMDDFEEQEVSQILSELEISGIINKISKEEYIYFPNGKRRIVKYYMQKHRIYLL